MRTISGLFLIVLAGSISLLSTAAAAETNCSAFPEELIAKWGREKQLVLNLSLGKGRNLKTMRETMGAPDPATFRTLADAFESTDFSGVQAAGTFQSPDVIAENLRKTADALEAALAAGENTADPAWEALAEFYTPQFFGKHNGAISFWLSEAGCA